MGWTEIKNQDELSETDGVQEAKIENQLKS